MKYKMRDKRVRDGEPSREGSHEGEVSRHQETLSTGESVESFGISDGNITRRGEKKTQNTHLTTTPNGEVAQTLASATSELKLNREARVA